MRLERVVAPIRVTLTGALIVAPADEDFLRWGCNQRLQRANWQPRRCDA
jgi:hypothetical protein